MYSEEVTIQQPGEPGGVLPPLPMRGKGKLKPGKRMKPWDPTRRTQSLEEGTSRASPLVGGAWWMAALMGK